MKKPLLFRTLALFIIVIYLSPNIFFPSKAKYLIHDNLDANVVWYKNLAESGKLFSSNYDKIERGLGGLERGCYASEFSFPSWLYILFSPITAYNINIIFLHFFAFFSFYIFSKKYIFKEQNEPLNIATSLIFGLLPFWPSGCLTIAGQPLLLYAFLNIINSEDSKKDWLIIIFFPLFSSFVLGNMFFIVTIFLLFVIHAFYKKRMNFRFIYALITFLFVSIAVEYRLFMLQIDGFESTRRYLGSKENLLNFKGVIGISFLHFLKGHYHFYSMHFPFIPLISSMALIFAKNKHDKLKITLLLLLSMGISLTFALTNWEIFINLFQKLSLPAIQIRFYSLSPFLWYIILSFSILLLYKINRLFKYVTALSLMIMLLMAFIPHFRTDYYGSDYAENSFFRTYVDNSNSQFLTFEDYYKKGLFKEVSKQIQPGDYYIGCIGLQPEVAQFNKYNTIGGYFPLASKESVERFEKIIMKKANSKRYYLDSFVEEKNGIITDLNFNFNELKKSKCKYLFSSNKIENIYLFNESSFSFNRDTLWVYEIK